MSVEQNVEKYLEGRKTGATHLEMLKALSVNRNTLRKVLGKMKTNGKLVAFSTRKCRVSGIRGRTVYGKAA